MKKSTIIYLVIRFICFSSIAAAVYVFNIQGRSPLFYGILVFYLIMLIVAIKSIPKYFS